MTQTMPETVEQVMIYTGSIELRDGPLHFVRDTQMFAHYGGYHPQTNTIFYGGQLEMTDPLTARVGQRYIRIQHGDRTELVSKFAEQCDAWHNMEDNAEMRADVERLISHVVILNPETKALLGTAAAQQYSQPAEGETKHAGMSVRLRLGEGVGLRDLPRGGWVLEKDGSISDASGTTMYVRAKDPAQGAPQATRRAAGTPPVRALEVPAPNVSAPAPRGLLGQLRRLFGGEAPQ